MKKPSFMMDDSETDGHAEIVMDYVLSWSLRLADEKYKNQGILHKYCRYILWKLLGLEEDMENIIFKDVKVYKEEKNIDLWVELKVVNGDVAYSHSISIENKYFSPINTRKDSEGKIHSQLEKYKQIFSDYYENEKRNGRDWNTHYVLITCIGRDDDKFKSYYEDDCDKNGYSLFCISDLINRELGNQDSKSDIFNEFWLREW